METIAITPEQGRQIVEHLRELDDQLIECLVEWRYQKRPPKKSKRRIHHPGPFLLKPKGSPEEEKFMREIRELDELSFQVEKQVEQGHVEKQLLIELNEKLGKIQADYGNILAFSATVAAIISGLKDLIDLFLGK